MNLTPPQQRAAERDLIARKILNAEATARRNRELQARVDNLTAKLERKNVQIQRLKERLRKATDPLNGVRPKQTRSLADKRLAKQNRDLITENLRLNRRLIEEKQKNAQRLKEAA